MDFNIPISQEILTSVSKLDQLRGRWSSGGSIPAARFERLREAAEVQSAAASCRLAGIRVSDADVSSILPDASALPSDAEAVRGYAAALRYPLPSAGALLTAENLGRLNATLLGFTSGDPTPSRWRKGANHREAFDADGKATGRVYSTLPARMLDCKMDDLLTWFEFELRTGQRHPVLVCGVFVLGFLAASPFEVGNGRTGRILIQRLLERAGYGYVACASIEVEIEKSRLELHEAFDRSNTKLWSGDGDVMPWLEYYLGVLDNHRARVETKIDLERAATEFPPLQQAILETVREHGTVDAALLLQATSANRNTLKDNLRRLVDRGVLEKSGQRRGTRYRLAVID